MAYDFPASPAVGQQFTPSGGPTWQWDGLTWGLVTALAIADAPSDGSFYGRVNGAWSAQYTKTALDALLAAKAPATAIDNNLLVNAGFQHSQENPPGNVWIASGTYLHDQWQGIYVGPVGGTHLNMVGYQPSASVGFGSIAFSSLGTTYPSPGAGNYFSIGQLVEGLQVAMLKWGAADAIPAVLSFEMFSGVAGTFAVAINSGTSDRSIVFPIVIAAGEVNTWKKFTFAVPAVTSGTFPRDTSRGIGIWFTPMCGTTFAAPSSGAWLNANYLGLTGQSNMLATANITSHVRKIGLYPDPFATGVAPTFDMPDAAAELVKCQRYFWTTPASNLIVAGYHVAGGTLRASHYFPVSMRVAPSIALLGISYNNASGLSSSVQWLTGFRVACGVTAAGDAYAQFGVSANARLT